MYLGQQFRFNEDECYRPTRMEINTRFVRENFHDIKKLAGRSEVIATVKGNAYSHGIIPISKILYEEGCNWFGTAIIEEALALREAGIDRNIIILGAAPRSGAEAIVKNNIICACGSLEFASALAEASRKLSKRARVHIKIDTGMGRLGFFPDMAQDAAVKLSGMGLSIEGALTHFATSEENNMDYTHWQFRQFMETVDSIENAGIKIPFKHVCNSGAILSCPGMYLDAVRTGKMIYGIPLPGKPRPFPVRTIAEVKTAIADIKTLPPRSGISYSLKYITRGEQRIGIIPIGTLDGFTRLNPDPVVLVRGVRVPAVGTICMDQTMIDLTSVPDAAIDDEVVILGKQGNDEITLTEIAKKLNTIYSQTLAMFPFRMPRFYI
ncbi:MAG: alanine racemase [Synergistaceae bacterium]|nr:alanine racemase [Synergistaceae bacterium]